MSVEENKACIRRQIEEAWNKGDFSRISEFISPDYVYHSPAGELKGYDGFKKFVTIWRTACPDIHMDIEEMVGEEETVAVRLLWSGTFTGKFQDYEPTGKKIGLREAWFFHFKEGKDLGPLPYGNLNALLRQMGVLPPTGEIGK